MRIVIDGYNFIGRQKGLRGDLEAKRKKLILDLEAYRRVREFPVTVVFDGEGSDWPAQRGAGVEVLFGRPADDLIKRIAEELGSACTVVSSDREIMEAVRRSGGIALYSGEFERRLAAALASPIDREKEEVRERPPRGEKRGNPYRLSKEERRRRGRLEKL